jgi:WD40 repeat protein
MLGCGDDLGPRVPAAIAVAPGAPRVLVAGTLQLEATVVDASGREIAGHTVTFESSDTTVLTVDGSGLLTSRGTTGTSLITLASGDLTAIVEARVVLPPSSIVVSPRSLELDTEEQQGLSFTVTETNGVPLPGAEVTFENSDPSILRLESPDWAGNVLFVTGLAPGSATVTLTSGELTVEVAVTVGRFPSSVAITPADLVLSPGGSQQVTAALLDRTGEALEAPSPFTWSSSDQAVVTVSPSGVVASVGSEGWALITATVDTFTATLRVFVGTPPAGEMLARVELPWAAGLALTADGQYFVGGNDVFARGALPDFALPVQVPVGDAQVTDILVNADATRAYLVLGSFGSAVIVMDLTTNAEVDRIPVNLGSAWAVALSADGSVLTVGTFNGYERIDLTTKRSLGGTAPGYVSKLTHHPSKPLLYASGEAGVLELDDKSGEVVRRFRGRVNGHVLSPDGKRLYTIGTGGGGIGVWNLETGAQEPSVGSVWGTDLTISPDGRFLYVIYGSSHIVGNSRLYIVDPASGTELREVVTGGLAIRIAMSADGIAVISNEGAVAGELGWVDFVR